MLFSRSQDLLRPGLPYAPTSALADYPVLLMTRRTFGRLGAEACSHRGSAPCCIALTGVRPRPS